ncbi:MAG TPA: hypothetical protein VKB52_07555 [Rhodanobacteraceae bacterium]|nr:hypothetical protein [Rhodanobacteraceae bacterium]
MRVLRSCFVLAGLAASAAAAEPPAFESIAQQVTVTPKSGTTASIAVTLKPGMQLSPDVAAQLGLAQATSATGPRVAANAAFDFATFKQDQQRRDDLARRGALVPIFEGRHFKGWRQIARVDPQLITSAVTAKTPIDIPIDAFAGIPVTIDPSKELMITDLSVVEDPTRTYDACTQTGTPMGAWTFGRLMTDIANGRDASDLVEKWLRLWASDQTVNTFVVPNRAGISDFLLSTWRRTNGKLDLSQAPMRLLAIVNRIDLRTNRAYGGGDAGEGRFVFGVMNPSDCQAVPFFTLILEYGVPKSGCVAVRTWAQQWHALGSLKLGTPPFNPALQQLTDTFAKANANPARPNGSALNQLRSEEGELATPWELREFRLDGTSHLFVESTVAQTPDIRFNANPNLHTLTDYINANQAAILNGSYAVPQKYPGNQAFLGASAPNVLFFWNGIPPAISNDARHAFSLGTCSGCHGQETGTFFTHVTPRPSHQVAALSEFLIGHPGTLRNPGTVTKPDPVDSSPRTYGDLLARQSKLDAILGASCNALGPYQQALGSPLNMVH